MPPMLSRRSSRRALSLHARTPATRRAKTPPPRVRTLAPAATRRPTRPSGAPAKGHFPPRPARERRNSAACIRVWPFVLARGVGAGTDRSACRPRRGIVCTMHASPRPAGITCTMHVVAGDFFCGRRASGCSDRVSLRAWARQGEAGSLPRVSGRGGNRGVAERAFWRRNENGVPIYFRDAAGFSSDA